MRTVAEDGGSDRWGVHRRIIVGITGASVLVLVVFQGGPRSSGTLFWLAALVAVLVYIVDVKPAVVGVQGGGNRW